MPVRMGAPNPPVTFMLKKGGVANYGPLGGITGRDLQDSLEQAETAFGQQHWDEAIEIYRSILSRSNALAVVNLQLAAASRRKGDSNSALAAYASLLKGDPDNSKAHVGIADTYIEKGEAQVAEDGLVRAAQSPGTGREVFFTLGEMSFTRNDTSEAARWYKKATSVDPFWGKPLYKLGLCAMKSGDADGAATLMARVIAVDPVSPEAALAKASLESLKK